MGDARSGVIRLPQEVNSKQWSSSLRAYDDGRKPGPVSPALKALASRRASLRQLSAGTSPFASPQQQASTKGANGAAPAAQKVWNDSGGSKTGGGWQRDADRLRTKLNEQRSALAAGAGAPGEQAGEGRVPRGTGPRGPLSADNDKNQVTGELQPVRRSGPYR